MGAGEGFEDQGQDDGERLLEYPSSALAGAARGGHIEVLQMFCLYCCSRALTRPHAILFRPVQTNLPELTTRNLKDSEHCVRSASNTSNAELNN